MSTALTTLRRRTGQELGGFGVFTAESGTTTSVICTAAFQSTELPTSALAYAWLFAPSIAEPRQRRVQATGLVPGTGQIGVEGGLGASLSVGTIFELHSKLPAVRDTAANKSSTLTLGLHEAINLALRHILIEDDTLTVTLANGTYDYPLGATWSWLDRAERLVEVRQPNATGETYVPAELRGHAWEFRENQARGSYLHFHQPYKINSGTHTLKLVALRPADTLIKVSNIWTDMASGVTGLVNESDEAAPDVNAIVTVALAFAYRAKRDGSTSPARERWDGLYADQVRLARAVKGYDKTNDIDPGVPAEAPSMAGVA